MGRPSDSAVDAHHGRKSRDGGVGNGCDQIARVVGRAFLRSDSRFTRTSFNMRQPETNIA